MRCALVRATDVGDVSGVPWAARGVLTFGSWALNVHVHATALTLLEELARLFREIPQAVVATPQRRGAARLYLLPSGAVPDVERRIARVLQKTGPIPPDGFVSGRAGDVDVLCTEMVRVAIVAGVPSRIYFVVDARPSHDLSLHLSFAMHWVLFHFDRILLHAGAVRLGRCVHLFVGERGAGKTTITLRLAAAGGTLLSDDHVVVRRTPSRFSVSGCSGRARLATDTERFLLPRPLRVRARDFAGVRKKEVDASRLCRSQPFRDYAVGALYFPRVGRRFAVRPMSRHQAMAELLRSWRAAMRFGDAGQLADCFDYFAALASSVEPFSLELSRNLSDLDALVSFALERKHP